MLKKGKFETLCYVIDLLRKPNWTEDFDSLIRCNMFYFICFKVLEVLEIGFKVEFH